MGNGNGQNQQQLVPQIAALTKKWDGWIEDPVVFEAMLKSHKFTCDHTDVEEDTGKVLWKCTNEPVLANSAVKHQRGGRTIEDPMLYFAEIAAMVGLETVHPDGTRTPVRDRHIGEIMTERRVAWCGVFCYPCLKRLLEDMAATAKQAGEPGSGVPEGTYFDPKNRECYERYGLYEHLNWLRGEVASEMRGRAAVAFFLAFARGEKTLEEAFQEGFLKPLPPEGEDLPKDAKGLVTHHPLAVGVDIVGVMSHDHAEGYDARRKADEEAKRLFNRAGMFLYWCSIADARKRIAEWSAGRPPKRGQPSTPVDGPKVATMASRIKRNLGLGQPMVPVPAAKSSGNGNDRRHAPRVKRDGPKPPQRQDEAPDARAQIDEGLAEAQAAREAAKAKRAAEPEEPRGSKPSKPMATLGEIAGVDLLADATSAKTE